MQFQVRQWQPNGSHSFSPTYDFSHKNRIFTYVVLRLMSIACLYYVRIKFKHFIKTVTDVKGIDLSLDLTEQHKQIIEIKLTMNIFQIL